MDGNTTPTTARRKVHAPKFSVVGQDECSECRSSMTFALAGPSEVPRCVDSKLDREDCGHVLCGHCREDHRCELVACGWCGEATTDNGDETPLCPACDARLSVGYGQALSDAKEVA